MNRKRVQRTPSQEEEFQRTKKEKQREYMKNYRQKKGRTAENRYSKCKSYRNGNI